MRNSRHNPFRFLSRFATLAASTLCSLLLACSGESPLEGIASSSLEGQQDSEDPSEQNGSVASLHLEILGGGGVAAGSCLILRLSAQDSRGERVVLSKNQNVVLSTSQGRLFSDDNCEDPAEVAKLRAGTEWTEVSFLSPFPGTAQLTADETPAQGWTAAKSEVIVRAGGVALAITPDAESFQTYECGRVQVELQNEEEQPSQWTEDLKIAIRFADAEDKTLPDTTAYANSTCTEPIQDVVLPAGSSQVYYSFRSGHPGKMKFVVGAETGEVFLGGQTPGRIWSVLEGDWQTGCTLKGSISEQQFLSIHDATFEYTKQVFDSCSVGREPLYEITHRGRVRLFPPTESPTRPTQAADFLFDSSCASPLSTAQAETWIGLGECSLTNWEVGVCTEITGRTNCAATEPARSGDTVRERFAMENEEASLLTFTSTDLYPSSSLNMPGQRRLSVNGVTFSRRP